MDWRGFEKKSTSEATVDGMYLFSSWLCDRHERRDAQVGSSRHDGHRSSPETRSHYLKEEMLIFCVKTDKHTEKMRTMAALAGDHGQRG